MKRNLLFRRGMSLLACLLMVISMMAVLSGCGEEPANPNGDNGGNNDGGNNKDESSLLSVLKQGSNDTLDLGGKELTISVWGGVVQEGQDPYFDRRYAKERLTEKAYNVQIEWMENNTSTFVQDVTLAYTSQKKYADLIFCPSTQGFDLCRLGAIQPLDDYINYDSKWYQMTANADLFVDGKHYSYMPDENNANNIGLFITYNKTILEEAGCADPYTLYQEGKWDWDAFYEIIEKTTKKDDAGKVTQWGVGGSFILEALCLSNGVDMIGMDTANKKFTCNLYSDAGLEALNLMKKIGYDLKGCDGNYGGHNSLITFGDSKLAMLISASYYPGSAIQKGMDVHSVPLPRGPKATSDVNGLSLQEWWCVGTISDFSVKDALQVALHMNDNNPANADYEDPDNYATVYLTPEEVRGEFIERTYDGCVFYNEYESEFYWDFIHDEDVHHTLVINPADIIATLSAKVFGPICQGEDPRTVLERVKPVIDEALKDMLPKNMQ